MRSVIFKLKKKKKLYVMKRVGRVLFFKIESVENVLSHL